MLAAAALALFALSAPAPEAVTLRFELKLQHRGQFLWWSTGVDQWARAELELTPRPAGDARDYALVAALEEPWVLRWYPRSDELKLGAVASVAEVTDDDAYDALAPRWSTRAEALAASWWHDDPAPEGDTLPPWIGRTGGFWSACRAELPAPPLADDPVYPFHVLGPTDARLRFSVDGTGRLDSDSIVETMSEPWLTDGWSRARAGESPVGYGYWAARRPKWEPALYQAIARALQLLDWPLPEGAAEIESGDALARAAAVVATLNPRAAGRLEWSGSARSLTRSAGPGRVVFDSGEQVIAEPATRWRLWRAARYVERGGAPVEDDLHLLVEAGCELRLWLRIGYRELQRASIASSSSR